MDNKIPQRVYFIEGITDQPTEIKNEYLNIRYGLGYLNDPPSEHNSIANGVIHLQNLSSFFVDSEEDAKIISIKIAEKFPNYAAQVAYCDFENKVSIYKKK